MSCPTYYSDLVSHKPLYHPVLHENNFCFWSKRGNVSFWFDLYIQIYIYIYKLQLIRGMRRKGEGGQGSIFSEFIFFTK